MKVSLNVCFLCHLNISDSTEHKKRCTVCHHEVKAKVTYKGKTYGHTEPMQHGYLCISCHASVKVGEGTVAKERCFFCHVDRAEKFRDPAFVHQQHVSKKQIDCFFCHQLVEHGNIRLEKNLERIFRGEAPSPPPAEPEKSKQPPTPDNC